MKYNGRLRYVVLGALSLLFFVLNAATFNALGVILPFMVSDLGWSWAIAGAGFTLLGIACGLSGLLPAILIRQFGVSRTMLIGGSILLLGFACLGLTTSATIYFAGTIFLGIGFTICGQVPAVNVISHSFEKRSTALGIYFTTGGLGSVAGPLIAYATQEVTNEWRYYWGGAAITAVMLSVFAAAVTANRWNSGDSHEQAQQFAPQTGWSVRAAIRTPQYYIIVGVYTSFLLINTTVHGFAVQHLTDKGISVGTAATVMSVIALISAGGSTLAGLAGEKLKPRFLTLLSLGAAVAGVLSLSASGGFASIAIAAAGLGIGFGFSYVSVAMLLLDMFGKRPNLELYSTMSLISTSAAIGPALGGFVRDATGSFSYVFIACALLGAVFIMALLVVRHPIQPKGSEEDKDASLAPA